MGEHMNKESQILNAQITSVTLGYGDCGVFSFSLSLYTSDGKHCTFGKYPLDEYDMKTGKRICSAHSMRIIAEIIETVGVKKWEDCKDKYIRVVSNGNSSEIKIIGNIIKDQWFDLDEHYCGPWLRLK